MPVEEITLSVPNGNESNSGSKTESVEDVDASELLGAYLKSARARDGFAFTAKARLRNRERFGQSLKALVKGIATRASNPVNDRHTRMAVRTHVYTNVMQLATAMSKDQQQIVEKSRKRLRWTLALAILGLLSVAATLAGNTFVT